MRKELTALVAGALAVGAGGCLSPYGRAVARGAGETFIFGAADEAGREAAGGGSYPRGHGRSGGNSKTRQQERWVKIPTGQMACINFQGFALAKDPNRNWYNVYKPNFNADGTVKNFDSVPGIKRISASRKGLYHYRVVFDE